jgi:glycosyltransferase involved in cell wall biosynthesis
MEAFKTGVVRSLIDLTASSFEHSVISLNRRSPGARAFASALLAGAGRPTLRVEREAFPYGEAWRYMAPARGLYHASLMDSLGLQIARSLAVEDAPDLLVAHKLSVEGLAVHRAAGMLGCPYAVAIQGDTDTKILAARPDLRACFARVFHEAAIVFPFAPWALEAVEAKLGKRKGPVRLLPCPIDLDTPMAPQPSDGGLLSAFHLKNWKRKNLPVMVRACDLLERKQGLALTLDIVGGGTDEQVAACRKVIGANRIVRLEGTLDREALRQRMNRAAAFVMPSRRETFGLVFIEALFAGLPVIYPRGAAISGYLDGAPFALAVDARDPEAVAEAMVRAVDREQEFKVALAAWQHTPGAKRFQRGEIAEQFAAGLRESYAPLQIGDQPDTTMVGADRTR